MSNRTEPHWCRPAIELTCPLFPPLRRDMMMPVISRTAITVATLGLVAANATAQCTPPIQRLVTDRKFDEARTQAQSVLAHSPNDEMAVHCLGMISVEMKRPREAVGHFERAVKLNDKSSLHHLWLGNALGDLADSTSKIKQPFLARRIKSEFERAVELDPRSVEARKGLIQFFVQAPGVMGGSIDKAKDQAREIGKINAMRGHWEMGKIQLHDKHVAEAEAEYLAAIKDSPDSAVIWYATQTFYQNQQRWADAFALYDRMLTQFPSDPMVHFQIGRTAAISGEQLDRGESELKAWIASPPKDAAPAMLAGAHHRLGMIFEKQGRRDQARVEYNTALAIDPNSQNAKKSLAALK